MNHHRPSSESSDLEKTHGRHRAARGQRLFCQTPPMQMTMSLRARSISSFALPDKKDKPTTPCVSDIQCKSGRSLTRFCVFHFGPIKRLTRAKTNYEQSRRPSLDQQPRLATVRRDSARASSFSRTCLRASCSSGVERPSPSRLAARAPLAARSPALLPWSRDWLRRRRCRAQASDSQRKETPPHGREVAFTEGAFEDAEVAKAVGSREALPPPGIRLSPRGTHATGGSCLHRRRCLRQGCWLRRSSLTRRHSTPRKGSCAFTEGAAFVTAVGSYGRASNGGTPRHAGGVALRLALPSSRLLAHMAEPHTAALHATQGELPSQKALPSSRLLAHMAEPHTAALHATQGGELPSQKALPSSRLLAHMAEPHTAALRATQGELPSHGGTPRHAGGSSRLLAHGNLHHRRCAQASESHTAPRATEEERRSR